MDFFIERIIYIPSWIKMNWTVWTPSLLCILGPVQIRFLFHSHQNLSRWKVPILVSQIISFIWHSTFCPSLDPLISLECHSASGNKVSFVEEWLCWTFSSFFLSFSLSLLYQNNATLKWEKKKTATLDAASVWVAFQTTSAIPKININGG